MAIVCGLLGCCCEEQVLVNGKREAAVTTAHKRVAQSSTTQWKASNRLEMLKNCQKRARKEPEISCAGASAIGSCQVISVEKPGPQGTSTTSRGPRS